VDTLVVYLHWGVEKDTCPTARQQELAAAMTAAGADIVVGTHAHRLQGMGYLGDQFVAYGLSNFVFKAPSEPGRRSGVLTVSATGRRIDGYRWDPAVLQGTLPVPLTGAAADAERAAMDELRGCTDLSATPTGPGVGS
jgi:poly-gamma-glutamate synthesis protein (capsule biosynthesis protein)